LDVLKFLPSLARVVFGHAARAEFRDWAEGVAAVHGYTVSFQPLGEEDAALGAPAQLALFEREDI